MTQYPSLGRYRPLHLLRRLGPLLEGVVLDRTSGNNEYFPTFHVHCLAKEFPAVSLTLAHRLSGGDSGLPVPITVGQHDVRFVDAANRLRQQSPLPLDGDLRLDQVLDAYAAFSKTFPARSQLPSLFEDMSRMCALFERAEQARSLVEEGYARLGEWPQQALDRIGGREPWRERALHGISDRERLLATVQEQVQALKVEHVPVARMLAN